MTSKRVIVEIRIPIAIKERDVLSFAGDNIELGGFVLDRTYEPVPAAPIESMAGELDAAGETVFTIRGTIREDAEDELKRLPVVVNVWTDAVVEGFDGD
jgi:hypothetical protein